MKIKHDPWLLATLATCAVALAWFQWIATNNWLVGRWYLADVGNVQYMMLNTLRGSFMHSPLTDSQHYAYHFTPLLTLLSPVALLSTYPIPLVATYNLALALCPLPLYMLARQRGLSGAVAWAVGVLFIGNHYTGSVQLAYHFESWFIFLLLLTIALFRDGRAGTFWVAAGATLAVKEDAAVWLGCFALYALAVHWRTPLARRSIRLGVFCAGYAVLAVGVMWWSAKGQQGNALTYVDRAGGFAWGADVIKSFALLVISVGGLCLLGGRATLLLIVALPLLLSRFEMTRHLLYYYSYPVLPFLFLAAIEGAGRLSKWMKAEATGQPGRQALLAAALCAIGLGQAVLPTRTDGYRRLPAKVTARHQYRLQVAREVLPKNTPTAIQFGLWGITPARHYAVMLHPDKVTSETMLFLDLKAPYGMPPGEFVELVRPWFAQVEAGDRKLLHDRDELYVIGPAKSRNGR